MKKTLNSRPRTHKAATACVVCAAVMLAACLGLAACAPQQAASKSTSVTHGELAAGDALTVETPITATADAIPTECKHEAHGVECIQCHGTADPTSAPTSDEACLSCHNYDTLVASTADMEDIPNRGVNPHSNHMHGTSCFSCHSEHGTSKVACNDCHTNEYHWLVP